MVNRLGMFALCSLLGCASAEDPPTVKYTVDFPSIGAARATQLLSADVFEVPDKDPQTCLNLVQRRRTNQMLPKPITTLPATTPCNFAAAPPLEVSYGKRAILVIAKGAGDQNLLIGCSQYGLGDGSPDVTVHLTLFDGQSFVPATSCTKLSDLCAGRCM